MTLDVVSLLLFRNYEFEHWHYPSRVISSQTIEKILNVHYLDVDRYYQLLSENASHMAFEYKDEFGSLINLITLL